VKTDAWHHRADAITSLAAFIGISIALIGGKGYESADDWAALFACLLIGFNGWRLLIPSLNEAMDVAPPPAVAESVRSAALATPGVVALEQCRVRKMGLDFYVDLHVEVNGSLTVREGHRIAHEVKDAIRQAEPAVVDVLVHIEPADDASAPPDRA
jgi:cation diffusion facilitator family transporter